MSKEKQVENTARAQINGMVKVLEASCDEAKTCICDCDLCKATALYNAGCRMQREGEWVTVGNGIAERVVCSNCKSQKGSFMKPPFCNQCGAKMKGGE